MNRMKHMKDKRKQAFRQRQENQSTIKNTGKGTAVCIKHRKVEVLLVATTNIPLNSAWKIILTTLLKCICEVREEAPHADK